MFVCCGCCWFTLPICSLQLCHLLRRLSVVYCVVFQSKINGFVHSNCDQDEMSMVETARSHIYHYAILFVCFRTVFWTNQMNNERQPYFDESVHTMSFLKRARAFKSHIKDTDKNTVFNCLVIIKTGYPFPFQKYTNNSLCPIIKQISPF